MFVNSSNSIAYFSFLFVAVCIREVILCIGRPLIHLLHPRIRGKFVPLNLCAWSIRLAALAASALISQSETYQELKFNFHSCLYSLLGLSSIKNVNCTWPSVNDGLVLLRPWGQTFHCFSLNECSCVLFILLLSLLLSLLLIFYYKYMGVRRGQWVVLILFIYSL